MNACVRSSSKSDIRAAVEETIGNVKEPKLFIYNAPTGRLAEVAEEIQKVFPHVPSIGTTGTALFGNQTADDVLVVAALCDGITVLNGVIKDAETCPIYDEVSLRDKANSLHPGKDDTVCLEFVTNSEEKMVSTMNVSLGGKVPIVGGSVFDAKAKGDTKVAVNGKLYANACAYALIKNNTGKIRTYTENIYKLVDGGRKHVATKVNRATKELVEMDGVPAATQYSEDLNIPVGQITGNVLKNPLGRIVGDDVYIASQYDIGRNNSLVCYKQVNMNDTVGILELDDYKQIRKDMNERMRRENKKISFIFTVNCIYRLGLFNNEGYTHTYLQDLNALGPYLGYTGGGEQYKSQHVNQTMVAAVFE